MSFYSTLMADLFFVVVVVVGGGGVVSVLVLCVYVFIF